MASDLPKVIIPREEYDKMLSHAVSEKPAEACGLLGGYAENDGQIIISKVYLLDNDDKSAEHFTIVPEQHLATVKDMRSLGLSPVGNWHSHPNTPSRPSDEDIRLAYDKNAVYMILSLAETEPVLNAFRIANKNAVKLTLIITED